MTGWDSWTSVFFRTLKRVSCLWIEHPFVLATSYVCEKLQQHFELLHREFLCVTSDPGLDGTGTPPQAAHAPKGTVVSSFTWATQNFWVQTQQMSAIGKSNLPSFIIRKKNGKTNQTISAKTAAVAFSHTAERNTLSTLLCTDVGFITQQQAEGNTKISLSFKQNYSSWITDFLQRHARILNKTWPSRAAFPQTAELVRRGLTSLPLQGPRLLPEPPTSPRKSPAQMMQEEGRRELLLPATMIITLLTPSRGTSTSWRVSVDILTPNDWPPGTAGIQATKKSWGEWPCFKPVISRPKFSPGVPGGCNTFSPE